MRQTRGYAAAQAHSGQAPRSSRTQQQPRGRRRPAAPPPAAASAASSDNAAAAHSAAAAAAAGRDARHEIAVLGGEDYILSQRSGVSEDLFKGDVLGVDADVASVDFRQEEALRSLSHLPEGLEPSKRFLDRVAVHFARNLLAGKGVLPGHVPLVLGIWGPKGAGKTFTLELCLRRMGVAPVCLSAGELEDEWAGEPGRRLRERYAFAARHAESTGQPTCLVISDLDAGVGTFADTWNTVNTQNLQGSLMALADDPLAVSTGQAWGAIRPRTRVPIYITANDLNLLYAPLAREGRMDKFYFEPTREEMLAALTTLFSPDLGPDCVAVLLDAFPQQPMDFFGSIKSRMADGAVRRWLKELAAGGQALDQVLLGETPASSSSSPPDLAPGATLAAALAAGASLAEEQQAVMDIRLSFEYFKGLEADILEADDRKERWRRQQEEREARHLAAEAAAEAARARAGAAVREAAELRVATAKAAAAAARQAGGGGQIEQAAWDGWQDEVEEEAAEEEPGPPATASGLPGVTPDELAAALRDRSVVALDVRSARDWDWGRIKGAAHAPYVLLSGSSLSPEARANPAFLEAARAKLGPPEKAPAVVLYGPGAALDSATNESFVSKELFVSIAPNSVADVGGEDIVAAAARELQAAGYGNLSELAGGFRAWDLAYRPDGRRRAKGVYRDKSSGQLEYWTASAEYCFFEGGKGWRGGRHGGAGLCLSLPPSQRFNSSLSQPPPPSALFCRTDWKTVDGVT